MDYSIPPLIERLLQESNNGTDFPTPAPSRPTQAPSSSPPPPLSEQEQIGFGIMVVAIVLACCFMYFCYHCWQQRRERRLMDLVNAHADNMLGDMVMVRTRSFGDESDDDRLPDDAELI